MRVAAVTLMLASLTMAWQPGRSGAPALQDGEDGDPSLEQRVMAFSQQLRCLVCQNETLADSQAELAIDLRQEILRQMKAGRSNEDITAFLTERYGDFVLYQPPLKPSTYALWFGPFVLLGGGLFALYRRLTHGPLPPGVRGPSAGERERVRNLLKRPHRIDDACTTAEANLVIYRQQLAEMEADRRAGILTEDQFLRDRDELETRLIADVPKASRSVRRGDVLS